MIFVGGASALASSEEEPADLPDATDEMLREIVEKSSLEAKKAKSKIELIADEDMKFAVQDWRART